MPSMVAGELSRVVKYWNVLTMPPTDRREGLVRPQPVPVVRGVKIQAIVPCGSVGFG
jgi:hypothetical protein